MSFRYSYILPPLCLVWFYSTFIITYFISISKNDVAPAFLPYISDTGNWSPESCFFGIMLNIGAIIQASIVYIRYRQVKHLIKKEPQIASSVKKLCKISPYFGYLGAFGVCLVANFQETNLLMVHLTGALFAFGLGGLYEWMETRISFLLYPLIGNKTINYIRVCCCVISLITFFLCCTFGGTAMLKFTGEDPTKWTKNDEGYTAHFISAVTEWIMAFFSILFLGLFYDEFKNISFSEPPITEEA